MREIGGYFEWEMAYGGGTLHPEAALVMKSARSCLDLLLRRERPRKIRVPYYICDAALEPVDRASTGIEFYSVNEELEMRGDWPDLADDERLLVLNYFGLKSSYVHRLESRYGAQLWVDDVQAFFHIPASSPAAHFNSARKFFGVPDGAYLYLPESVLAEIDTLSYPVNTSYRLEHLTRRLEGRTLEGHRFFQENDRLSGGEIAAVSDIGRAMLNRIDYTTAALVRRENYAHLHAVLGPSNRLSDRVLQLGGDAVPFCYPYLPPHRIERQLFWDRKVFVPAFWRECTKRGRDSEKELAAKLLPLPIDQRYNTSDMDRVIATVQELSGFSP